MTPPSWTSLPPPSLLYCYRAPVWALWIIYSKFPLAVYFTYGNVSFHVTLFIHLTLSFLSPPSPMPINLFSMSVSEENFISTIFLDSIYICQYMIFIFNFLNLHSSILRPTFSTFDFMLITWLYFATNLQVVGSKVFQESGPQILSYSRGRNLPLLPGIRHAQAQPAYPGLVA